MSKRPYLEFDTECAPNWWLLKVFYPMGHMKSWALHPHKPNFSMQELGEIQSAMRSFTWVGFNSLGYDEPMIKAALAGVGVHVLKQINDAIIVQGVRRWELGKVFPFLDYQLDDFDHIDIMEVAPGVRIGLKTYMARMHSPTIQDLPFDPTALLTEDDQIEADDYCGNDLKGTRQLRETITKRIELRERLSIEYGTDLRSKSDAQMSEAIIAARLGYKPTRRDLPTGYQFQLKVAPWLQFVTPQMQEVFEICKRAWFFWSNKEDGEPIEFPDGGKIKTGVNIPKEIGTIRVRMGTSVYKFGIGGLHSTESAQSVYADNTHELSDHDVGSFYPRTTILMQLFNPEIMPIYADIFRQRMENKGKIAALKAACKEQPDNKQLLSELGDVETITDGFKIVMNGGYGKLWNKYSFLLDPEAGIAITLNGQLSLLMLIERLEVGGIRVISANTDGIVLHTPAHLTWYREQVLKWWEQTTGYDLEATPYRAIHSRDVNSYVAVKPNGEAKRKGVFSSTGVLASMQGVHPDREISKDAVVAYLTKGTPIAETVRACTDITRFILAKSVKGGGQWRGGYLGKTVRWYLSTQGEPIRYVSNGNKVAGSDGAVPIQRLPDAFPPDVDYQAYVDFAIKLLEGTGVKCA